MAPLGPPVVSQPPSRMTRAEPMIVPKPRIKHWNFPLSPSRPAAGPSPVWTFKGLRCYLAACQNDRCSRVTSLMRLHEAGIFRDNRMRKIDNLLFSVGQRDQTTLRHLHPCNNISSWNRRFRGCVARATSPG